MRSILDGGTGLTSKNSAVNTSTSSILGTSRFQHNVAIDTYDPTATAAAASVFATSTDVPTQDKPPTNSVATTSQAKNLIPLGFKWNLPPHDWSLPTRPTTIDPKYVFNQNSSDFHSLRRGRIWFWDVASEVQNVDSTGSIVKAQSTTLKDSTGAQQYQTDRKWGFQFLWNPESINTQVARNMDITPSNADALRVVSGAFPGQETFTVTIVLDRVNDFACCRGTNLVVDANGTAVNTASLAKYQSSYYKSGEHPGADTTSIPFSEKLTKVMSQGTMADLEYLFRAINGTFGANGVISTEWSNLLGKKTANIGYLQPSLMAFQFGPTLDNLSWVGWISSLSLNHIMFTENMIPLRTEVSIAVEAFTGSGVGSA